MYEVDGEVGEGDVAGGEGRAGVGAGAGIAGCSSVAPSSRIDGSEGGGPSRAHRRDSYLDRMKESILL